MICAPVEKPPDESTLARTKWTKMSPKIAASAAFTAGPANDTSTP